MIQNQLGKCYYCKKVHDLRVACPEYVRSKALKKESKEHEDRIKIIEDYFWGGMLKRNL